MNQQKDNQLKDWMRATLETPPMGFSQRVMRRVVQVEAERKKERRAIRLMVFSVASVLVLCFVLSLRLEGYFEQIQWPQPAWSLDFDYRMALSALALSIGLWVVIAVEVRRFSKTKADSGS